MRGFVRIIEVVFAFTIIFLVLTNIQTNIPPRYEDTNDLQRLNQLAGDIALSICNSEDFRYDLVKNRMPVNLSVRIDKWTEKVKEGQATYAQPLENMSGTARQTTELNMSAEKIRLCVNTLNATKDATASICGQYNDVSCDSNISAAYGITGMNSAGTYCTQWFNFTLNSSNTYVMSLYSLNLQNITYQDNGKKGLYFHAGFNDTQNTSDISSLYTDYSNNPIEMFVQTLHDMDTGKYVPKDVNYRVWLYSNSTANWLLDDPVNDTGNNKVSKTFYVRVTMSGLGANVTLVNDTYANGTTIAENLSNAAFNGTYLSTASTTLPLSDVLINTTLEFYNASYSSRITSVDWLVDGSPVKTQRLDYVGDVLNSPLMNDSSLISYWRFEKNPLADEESRNRLLATGGAHNVSGRFGSGYSFNSSGYAYASDNETLNVTANITLFGWVRTAMTGDYVGIVAKDYSYHILKDAAGKIEGDLWLGGNKMEVHSSKAINDGLWHSFALTYDGGYVKLYVDGVRDEAACWRQGPGYITCPIYNESTIRKYAGPLYIGQGYGGRLFNGTVDGIAVFNRALASQEILMLNETELSQTDLSFDPALVSYWRFEGGEDSKGSNDAALSGAVSNSSGRFENAYTFDGVNDWIETQSPYGSAQNITISMWAKPGATHLQGYGGLMSNINGRTNSRLLVQNNGTPLAQVSTSSGTQNVNGPALTIGSWNHIIYRFNGTHEAIFTNGVKGSDYARTGTVSSGTDNTTIGWGYNTHAFYHFNGSIDDVALFSRALTDSEIASLYGRFSFGDVQLPHYDDSKNPTATASCIISGYGKEYAPKKIVAGVWNR